MATEQAGYERTEQSGIRQFTDNGLLAVGPLPVPHPQRFAGTSGYARQQYHYPLRATREEAAFGDEEVYPTQYEVDVPHSFGELHHQAPRYERVSIRSAVREGSPIQARRRNRGALVVSSLLVGSIFVVVASCNETLKQRLYSVQAWQTDGDDMPTHIEEEPGPIKNPLIEPYPLPSVDPKAPLQEEINKPTNDATSVASPVNARAIGCVKRWALERQVGQLLILPIDAEQARGAYALREQATRSATKRIMRELHVGGIVLTGGTAAEKQEVKESYSVQGSFEAPLLIGDAEKDAWYGFTAPTLTTSVDMGGPALPGESQLSVAQKFAQELKGKTNAPVFLTDPLNANKPLSLHDQVVAMEHEAVRIVQRGELSADDLAEMVVMNFKARGPKGADPCAVKISR